MTLILQCLSALAAFFTAESNATKLSGWQPLLICRIPNTQHRDTSIMDLCVLLNKWHNDYWDERNGVHFYSRQGCPVQCIRAKRVQMCHHQQKMDPYWWWVNEEEWNPLGVHAPEGPDSLKSCQQLLSRTLLPGGCVVVYRSWYGVWVLGIWKLHWKRDLHLLSMVRKGEGSEKGGAVV